MSNDVAIQEDPTREFGEIEESFDVADLPAKLELRYAIETKRAEQGLEIPMLDETTFLPKEVRYHKQRFYRTYTLIAFSSNLMYHNSRFQISF